MKFSRIAFAARCAFVLSATTSMPAAAAGVADGLKCFKISDLPRLKGVADLDSADLGLDAGCKVGRAETNCVPVTSSVVSAEGPTGPLLAVSGPNPGDRICYKVKCAGTSPQSQEISNVFGTRTIGASKATTVGCARREGSGEPGPKRGHLR